MDSISLISSYILPSSLDYALPPFSSSPFCCFLPYRPISYSLQPLLWHVLALYCHFNFLTYLVVLSRYLLSCVLSTCTWKYILLVVLGHPNTCLVAVVCTVSSCSTNFAFSSHTSACSSFGTITFIRIHILILVSRCESVRIGSILPTFALPVPIYFLCVQPKSSLLRSLRQGAYSGIRSVINPLPFESYRVHLVFVTYRRNTAQFFRFAITPHFLVYPSVFHIVSTILRLFLIFFSFFLNPPADG